MIITREDFRGILFNVRGASMVSIVAETEPKLTGGKKCTFAGVKKISMVNGAINWNYQNAVNKQREKEDQPLNDDGSIENFVPHPRKWGMRLHTISENGNKRLLPLVAHNFELSNEIVSERQLLEIPVECLYLEYRPISSEYKYYLNGKEVDKAEVNKYLPPSSPGRQGVENQIILRDYKLNSIQQIVMKGEVYTFKAA